MGVREVEALHMARRLALFNGEVIYYVKNSLMVNTPKIQKSLDTEHEKFTILLRDNYTKIDIDKVLANVNNNNNHDLLKLDVDLIKDVLLEAIEDESSD